MVINIFGKNLNLAVKYNSITFLIFSKTKRVLCSLYIHRCKDIVLGSFFLRVIISKYFPIANIITLTNLRVFCSDSGDYQWQPFA